MKVRMIPVAHPGQDQLFEVCQDSFHRFAFRRTGIGEQSLQFSKTTASCHLMLSGVFQIVRDPFDNVPPISAEIAGVHIWALVAIHTGIVFTHKGSLVCVLR